jgi:hypothetical protein
MLEKIANMSPSEMDFENEASKVSTFKHAFLLGYHTFVSIVSEPNSTKANSTCPKYNILSDYVIFVNILIKMNEINDENCDSFVKHS